MRHTGLASGSRGTYDRPGEINKSSWDVAIDSAASLFKDIMGSVVKVYKNGKHVSWQARICRVGLPKFTLCFCTYDEASDWLNCNEERYIMDHKLVRL